MLDLILKGTAFDTEKNILANTEVILFDSIGNRSGTIITDATGKYEFAVERYSNYGLEGNKDKYISDEQDVDTHTEKLEIIQNLYLGPIPDFVFICNVTDN